MATTTISPAGVNLNAISLDTLSESYFVNQSQQLSEAKNQAKLKMDGAHGNADAMRSKRIKELEKYVKELTKGGFFRSFLKVFSFIMKILSPLNTMLDKALGAIFKGKLAFLKNIFSLAIQLAQTFFTGGTSLVGAGLAKFTKLSTEAINKIMRVVDLCVSVAKNLSDFGLQTLDLKKAKNLATHQKDAEKFSLLFQSFNREATQMQDQWSNLGKMNTQLFNDVKDTQALTDQGQEALAKF